MKNRMLSGVTSGVAGLSIASFGIVAYAQDALPSGDEATDTIVVTATKRGEATLQEVPFAIQAVSGDDLAARGAQDFNDYFNLVPGLSVFDQGPGDKRYIIRGINAVGAGTVGLYLDETVITGENAQDGGGRQPDVKLFDLERVEVLKGPQGTTFGSSSLSGTIRYITRKPQMNEFAVQATGQLRTTKGADVGYQFDGAVNIPLVEDRLAVRFSGLYLDEPGFVDRPLTFGDEDVNTDQTEAFRIQARALPADNVTIDLTYFSQSMQSDGRSGYNTDDFFGNALSDGDTFEINDYSRPVFLDDIEIFSAVGEIDAGFGVITAVASLYDRETLFERDASYVLGSVGPTLDPTTDPTIITQPKDRELQNYELRFASTWQSPLQLLAGVFVQKEERFFESRVLETDAELFFDPDSFVWLDRNVSTSIDEVAVFAEVSYDITDRLTITAGGRWFDFSIEELAEAVAGFGGSPGAGFGPVLTAEEDGLIGKGNISFQASDNVSLYAQVSQGFRSGGTNDTTAAEIAAVTIPAQFGSDSLVNYEVGAKSELADGRLIFNVSGYFIDWSDIQIQDQATDGSVQFPYRGNGGGAEVYGAEFEILARPMDGLELGLTANVLSAELSEDNPIPTSGMEGDLLPYAPDATLTAVADYAWELGNGLSASIGGDVVYVGSQTTALVDTDPVYAELDSFARVNLRAGIQADRLSFSIVANNLFDDDSVTAVYRNTAFQTPTYVPNRPRSFVFSVSGNF